MSWISRRAGELAAVAQSHEQSIVHHTEQAAEAHEFARLYRDLDSALKCGDVALVHDRATQLGLEVRCGRGGVEVVRPDEWQTVDDRDGSVVRTAREPRRRT